MRRRAVPMLVLVAVLGGAWGCDLVDPSPGLTPSVRVTWDPPPPASQRIEASAQGFPSEFLWAAERLDVQITDAEGVARSGSWELGPSGVDVDARFRIAPGPFTATAVVVGNGAGFLLQGSAPSDRDQVTIPLVAEGPVMAASPIVVEPTPLAADTLRIWNLGVGPMSWFAESLEPPNTACPSRRCLVFRSDDPSPIAPGGFREVLVAGWDTPGGEHTLTLRSGGRDAPDADVVRVPIRSDAIGPVGRITVMVTVSGAALSGAAVEIQGPVGARFTDTDAQGRAVFDDLPFGAYGIFVDTGPGGFDGTATLDAFNRDVVVEAAF